jgi:hypothetical protein
LEFAHDWKESSAASLHTAWPAPQALPGAVQCADSSVEESEQPFVPPSDVKGGPEKLPTEPGKISRETVVC